MDANVIRILDNFTLILNVGTRQGVREGTKFEIYDEGDEIIDITTSQNLGRFEFIKARVEVIRASKNYSVVQQIIITDPTSALQASMASLRESVQRAKKLPIDETEINPIKSTFEKTIRVGDKARTI